MELRCGVCNAVTYQGKEHECGEVLPLNTGPGKIRVMPAPSVPAMTRERFRQEAAIAALGRSTVTSARNAKDLAGDLVSEMFDD